MTSKTSDVRTSEVETQVLPIDALKGLAGVVVPRIRGFLKTMVDVASGEDPESDLVMSILAISELLSAGAHLGAIAQIVPPKRFEPDLSDDVDLDPLHEALQRRFGEVDEYPVVVDPLVGPEIEISLLSSDIALVFECLTHGLQHFDAGHQIEALWWWQHTYISQWGEQSSSILRMLQVILMHVRLDVPDDVAQEAQYEALMKTDD